MTSALAQPLRLPCGAQLPNRLMKAAMTEGLANVDGQVTPRLETLYRRWSEGGCGLLITGNVMIDRRYLERPGNLVVDDNDALPGLARLAAAGTAAGNHLWMQISHPGRQCSRITSGHPVSASDVQLDILGNFARPRALRGDEIEALIGRYAEVAAQAREAGFTGVQIHAAHGYLISQFLSPLTNRRDDDWGGTLAQRARFLLAIVRATRAAVGADFPVAVKLNSADFQRGGFSPDDSTTVAGWLAEAGIDLLEISGGTYEQPALVGLSGDAKTAETPKAASTRAREAYFLRYTDTMRAQCRVPLAVTGGFRSARFMQRVLAENRLDVIGIARPLCVDPAAAATLLEDEGAELASYERDLRFGGGPFGPASRLKGLRALNTQASVAWFYRQIIALAEERPVDRALAARRALWRHFRDEYRLGFARRKRLRALGVRV